jgi:dihydrofolate reductase
VRSGVSFPAPGAKADGDRTGAGPAPRLSLVVAMARFKAITMGKPMVMGRRTHESIGRPLPGRRNLVLSRQPGYAAAGCEVLPDLASALAAVGAAEEVMIVGGATLYAEALPCASRLYLTEVEADLPGDVHFPPLARDEWCEIASERHPPDARNTYALIFRVLQRER